MVLKKRTGTVMTEMLIDWGVNHVYGMPGDSINQWIDDLREQQENIQFIQVRHEEVGALAASAYAKLTGNLGVCMSIAGPGAVHLMNGLYDAKADKTPVLAIVGQVESDEIGTDAFQELNLERLFDDVAVFNKRAATEAQLPDLLNQAIREAYVKKGVSVLIVPDDLFAKDYISDNRLTSLGYFQPEISPSEKSLKEARSLLEEAEKPIILAGKGVKKANQELIEFAEHIKAPIILSLPAKGVIPDQHPYCLGQHGQIGTKPAYHAMMEADLVIFIGTQFPYRDFLPDDAKAIQIDTKPEHIGKVYPVDVGLAGDAKESMAFLTSHMSEKKDDAFLKKYQGKMKEWHVKLQEEKKLEQTPLHAPQVMYQLEQVMDKNAVVSCDVGNVTVWVTRFLPLLQQKFVISGYLATMGSGLPGAIAGQIAYPDRQAVAVCGDGGFTMVSQDFVTAVKYDLPIKVIILNNKSIGMIKYEQQQMGHQNYQTDLGEMNFADFAEACGGEGYRVEKYEDLENSMKKAFASNKPAIIDVVIEEQAPLPGHIGYTQAVNYSKFLIKEFFSNGKIELPDMKKAVDRLS